MSFLLVLLAYAAVAVSARDCLPTDMPFPAAGTCTCVNSNTAGSVPVCGNARKSSWLATKNNCGDKANFGVSACHLYAYTVCIAKSSPNSAVAPNNNYILNVEPNAVLVIPSVAALGYEEHTGVDPKIWSAAYKSGLNGGDANLLLSLSACSQRQYSQLHIHIGKAKSGVAKVFNDASMDSKYQGSWAPLIAPKSSGSGKIEMYCTEEKPSYDLSQTDIFKRTRAQIPASGFADNDVAVAVAKATNGIFICLVNKDNEDLYDPPSNPNKILKGGIN